MLSAKAIENKIIDKLKDLPEEDKKEILRRTKGHQYISGIYNFCDRLKGCFPDARSFKRPGFNDMN
ncbi:MAG: hypothetical protein AABY79_06510 [Nitrospirota bacterium]